ncbi:MAG: PD-(D/E)XK nuclease domain-containing protein, partial [Deltaproteobacteria bacterium]|nr:PD-(D/E)XK nuclease domain-containing protein [Deltaproteobacteria bacterium]
IEQINKVLSEYPYDYFQTNRRDEYFYCLGLFTFFYASGLTVQAEKHGNFGRADFILKDGKLTWVVEIKVSYGNADDAKLAAAALEQIIGKNHAGASPNPVLIGAVINDGARVIKAWKCRGGIEEKPIDHLAPKKPAKPKEHLDPEYEAEADVEEEKEHSGPKPH